MSKPRIGLAALAATNRVNDTAVAAVNRAYVDAVIAVGGLPILLPIQDPADALDAVSCVDGLLLCGGVDVDPEAYGAPAGTDICQCDQQRDCWELALTRAARQTGTPVLGVCRGAQILNVSMGGTLVRDVPTATGMNHRDTDRSHQVAHLICIEPGSLLAGMGHLLESGVNTLHHQAVDRPGDSLRPVAWGPDATIEAIESSSEWSAIGVQWHPELLIDHPEHVVALAHRSLFAWLIAAAQAGRLHAVDPAPVRPAEADFRQLDIEERQAS
jgi:putative glutamine amidotransferase